MKRHKSNQIYPYKVIFLISIRIYIYDFFKFQKNKKDKGGPEIGNRFFRYFSNVDLRFPFVPFSSGTNMKKEKTFVNSRTLDIILKSYMRFFQTTKEEQTIKPSTPDNDGLFLYVSLSPVVKGPTKLIFFLRDPESMVIPNLFVDTSLFMGFRYLELQFLKKSQGHEFY